MLFHSGMGTSLHPLTIDFFFFFGGDTPQLIAVTLHDWFTGGVFIFQFAELMISTEEQTIFLLPVASRFFITWHHLSLYLLLQ